MNHKELQAELQRLGHYRGAIDGAFGPASKAAFIAALTAGPDTPMSAQDINRAAMLLGVADAAVYAVYRVEANGHGFQDGRCKILPEPHRFSKLTQGRFDASHPTCSYPQWDKTKYPKTQQARYEQLAEMVSLSVDAGLMATSWGSFQIMGENYAMCGFTSPWAMAYALSLTEGDQLDAFIAFVRSKRLHNCLQRCDFDAFAAGFNGSAWRLNDYGNKLRAEYRACGGR